MGADGYGHFPMRIGCHASHKVCQGENDAALCHPVGVEVPFVKQQGSFGKAFGSLLEFNTRQGRIPVVLEIVENVHLVLNLAFKCTLLSLILDAKQTDMPILTIEPEILTAAPAYAGCVMACSVVNSLHAPLLWEEIAVETSRFRTSFMVEDINKLTGIYEMRQLYKKLGKDPNRYRPSAEALCRRLLLGKELYQINTLVDLINLVSIRTGFSIGGFDADKVQGELRIGVGQALEPFKAIGRGLLNIEGLPVYRDELGAIGTPTSDVERTKLSLETSHLLMVIHSAGGQQGLDEAVVFSTRLLQQHAHVTELQINRF